MKNEKTFSGLIHGFCASLREKMPASFNTEFDALRKVLNTRANQLKAYYQKLVDNGYDKTPPKFILDFDNWCDDRLWVLQAFLRGRLLCQKGYIPVDNRFYLPALVPLQRIVMLMKWWEIPEEEIRKYVRLVTKKDTGVGRLSFASVLALVGVFTEGVDFIGAEEKELIFGLRTRGNMSCAPMPEICMPTRGHFREQCGGAPIPPHIRRKEEKNQKFSERERIPSGNRRRW